MESPSAWVAMRDGDLDALGRLVSPELVTVDHQRIGFGAGDRDSFLDGNRSDLEVMRRGREYVRKGFASAHAFLVVSEQARLLTEAGFLPTPRGLRPPRS